jgi:1,4-alpha-glucan branching enzyme
MHQVFIYLMFKDILMLQKMLRSALCLIVLMGSVVRASQAQLLMTTSPAFLKEINTGSVSFTIDAIKGNQGLLNYTPANDIYVHIGAITNLSTGPTDWKYVQTTWTVSNASNQASVLGNNKWSFTVPSNLRTYFGITNAAEKIVRVAILFRNSTGTAVQRNSNGGDMYVPVDTTGNLLVKFTAPPTEPRYTPWAEPVSVTLGQTLPIAAVTSANATIDLFLNGVNIGSGSNLSSLSANPAINQSCINTIKVIATDGSTTVTDSLNFFVNGTVATFAPLPLGVQDGVNYLSGDTSVTLVLYAPKKSSVLLVGSFNNWQINCNNVMQRTPDSLRHWITVGGLTPGTIYQFQYFVDGIITTTDPYCELVLDPWNDAGITAATYPNMPIYPAGQSGMVGTFQTAAPAYNWTTTNYVRPDKRNLVVYELLLRDFLTTHDWKTLHDTLGYLKNLGINCIEIMPFNEFEGNNSWGYNPSFFFAPDKYYGSKNDLKKFIDKAHSLGIAVVMDAVLNQATGLSPLAQLYWNNGASKPTSDNPWLNVDATHPFNVFNDFNHESQMTKVHVRRFMKHWLQEYKLDGFRWDLAKGFTQVNSGSDVGAWSNYDASRVAIWKDYYDSMMTYSANSYCILEFLGGDQEESEYANYGMMLWGKLTDEYSNCVEGNNGANLDRAYHKNRAGYQKPGLIAYAESHDEERAIYSTLQFGNQSNINNHNPRTTPVALARLQAMFPMLLLIPGPKMIWEFGELGYDYGINYCPGTNTYNSSCRLDPKPIRWNYFTDAKRKDVYRVVSGLNALRALKPNTFVNETVTTGTDFGSSLIKKIVLDDADLKVSAISNFNVTSQASTMSFPANGWWYNYFGTDSINITNNTLNVNLAPGGYFVYINQKIGGPVLNVSIKDAQIPAFANIAIAPNPTTNGSTLFLELNSDVTAIICLTDITGRQVATLPPAHLVQGYQEISLTAAVANLVPGVYSCIVSTSQGTQQLKLEVQ